MIIREKYLETLISFKDKQLIKVVTGIRRYGKLMLFELFQNYLRKNGLKDSQNISINLEDGVFIDLDNNKQLYEYINKKIIPEERMYIFK